MILEQFVDQLRLSDSDEDMGNMGEVKCWAGIIAVEYDLEPCHRREWGSSSFENLIRLQKYKTWLQGRVIYSRE